MSLPDSAEYWWDVKHPYWNHQPKKPIIKEVECDICNKKVKETNLKTHKSIEHDMVPYGEHHNGRTCPICGKVKKGMIFHYRACHPRITPPKPIYY